MFIRCLTSGLTQLQNVSNTLVGTSSGLSTSKPGSNPTTLGFARPTGASIARGIAQKPAGGRAAPLSRPVFGVGHVGAGASGVGRGTLAMRTLGMSRVTQKVSKPSSLPAVAGSPVKGGGSVRAEDGADAMEGIVAEEPVELDGFGVMGEAAEKSAFDKIDDWLRNAPADVLRDLASDDEDSVGDKSTLEGDAPARAEDAEAKAKKREAQRNASRRASMASHLLTQSLSALPSTLSPATTDAKGKGRAVSGSWLPSATAAGASTDAGDQDEDAPPPRPHSRNTRLATGSLSTPPKSYKEPSLRSSLTAADGGGSAEGKKAKAKAQPAGGTWLKDCRVFVDVVGVESAGTLFADMLRDMGAKVRGHPL